MNDEEVFEPGCTLRAAALLHGLFGKGFCMYLRGWQAAVAAYP